MRFVEKKCHSNQEFLAELKRSKTTGLGWSPSHIKLILSFVLDLLSAIDTFLVVSHTLVRRVLNFLIVFILAAHCFHDKGQLEPTQAVDVTAMLGKHDLSNYNEKGAKNYSVQTIILHTEWQWDVKVNGSFHADIAIIVTNQIIKFSRYIQPVCLPQQSSAEVVGEGTISGWGQSRYDERHATTPNELNVPIVNAHYCLVRFPKLALIAWTTLFCAGYENQGKGACVGDSGGGFYSLEPARSSWIVRGIISGSLKDQNGQCDVNAFQLFTNVARFVDWIGKVMIENKNVVHYIVLEFVDFECIIR
jgi:secreted trypsin-like serine protease